MNNYLKYFEGKVCTLLTRQINRDFKEEAIAMQKPHIYPMNLIDHFVGRVVYADSICIVLEHPIIKTRSYFRTEHVVGIIEEQELDRNDPNNAKLIEEIQKRNAPVPTAKVGCPKGHTLNVPNDIPDGSEVVCPVCQSEFVVNRTPSGWIASNEKPAPTSESELVDIDLLSKLAREAQQGVHQGPEEARRE